MPLYDSIVRRLQIPEAFFERYSPVVREKFREVARRYQEDPSGTDSIKQCLHLASSVVLRQEPTDLDNALAAARQAVNDFTDLKGKDPETVLTVVTAYYLLLRERLSSERITKEEELDLQAVQQMLDQKHWLIGKGAMQRLGIEPCG